MIITPIKTPERFTLPPLEEVASKLPIKKNKLPIKIYDLSEVAALCKLS